jgi:hypothetical protein
LTLAWQDSTIALKVKLGFRLPYLRECLVREFPVSHNEAPRRDKSPGDHVQGYMAFGEFNLLDKETSLCISIP